VDLAMGEVKAGNGLPVVGPNSGSMYRSLENTVMALVGATVIGFALSKINNGKLKWTELHTCIIAGGISMGAAHNIVVEGWTALTIGSTAAIFAFIMLKWVQPWLTDAFKVRDVRNVFSTFAMPGVFAAIVGMIVTIIWVDSAHATNQHRFGQVLRNLFSRHPITLRNLGALCSSAAISMLGGGLVGLIINGMRETFPHLETDERLTDLAYFHVPIDA
jgi:ammonia channel protein AmtB